MNAGLIHISNMNTTITFINFEAPVRVYSISQVKCFSQHSNGHDTLMRGLNKESYL